MDDDKSPAERAAEDATDKFCGIGAFASVSRDTEMWQRVYGQMVPIIQQAIDEATAGLLKIIADAKHEIKMNRPGLAMDVLNLASRPEEKPT